MKQSSSRAKARLTPPGSETSDTSDTPAGPPTETIEIAVGPNTTGHTDQVVGVHADAGDDASADSSQEG